VVVPGEQQPAILKKFNGQHSDINHVLRHRRPRLVFLTLRFSENIGKAWPLSVKMPYDIMQVGFMLMGYTPPGFEVS
jgi:hypothetical protein